MRVGQAAIILEGAEQRIGIDLVTDCSQETAGGIAAEVVAVRCDHAGVTINDVGSLTTFQDGIPDLQHPAVVMDAPGAAAKPEELLSAKVLLVIINIDPLLRTPPPSTKEKLPLIVLLMI